MCITDAASTGNMNGVEMRTVWFNSTKNNVAGGGLWKADPRDGVREVY